MRSNLPGHLLSGKRKAYIIAPVTYSAAMTSSPHSSLKWNCACKRTQRLRMTPPRDGDERVTIAGHKHQTQPLEMDQVLQDHAANR